MAQAMVVAMAKLKVSSQVSSSIITGAGSIAGVGGIAETRQLIARIGDIVIARSTGYYWSMPEMSWGLPAL